ncbi:MAG: class I SAM-dependent methyltransferase [Myxococcaceae bacterium]|nr:class I SAM-dependent methyltransferase [Myxococcaceae bacterium]
MFHPDGPSLGELIVQALSSTDRGYDLLAPKFEVTPFRTPDAVLKVALDAAGEVDTALDLCCGTGAAMRHLRARCRRLVVGVDRSAGMLAEAHKRVAEAPGATPFALVRGDALALPFRRAFDLVTCFGAFGHIPVRDEPRFVEQIARALRPGGCFVFVTTDPIPWWHPVWWMARGFNAAMHLRNALRKPEFVMYYLTFQLPRATALLEQAGFTVETRRGAFSRPYGRLVLVIARREGA